MASAPRGTHGGEGDGAGAKTTVTGVPGSTRASAAGIWLRTVSPEPGDCPAPTSSASLARARRVRAESSVNPMTLGTMTNLSCFPTTGGGTIGVLTAGVLSAGVLSAGVLTAGVLTAGV